MLTLFSLLTFFLYLHCNPKSCQNFTEVQRRDSSVCFLLVFQYSVLSQKAENQKTVACQFLKSCDQKKKEEHILGQSHQYCKPAITRETQINVYNEKSSDEKTQQQRLIDTQNGIQVRRTEEKDAKYYKQIVMIW